MGRRARKAALEVLVSFEPAPLGRSQPRQGTGRIISAATIRHARLAVASGRAVAILIAISVEGQRVSSIAADFLVP